MGRNLAEVGSHMHIEGVGGRLWTGLIAHTNMWRLCFPFNENDACGVGRRKLNEMCTVCGNCGKFPYNRSIKFLLSTATNLTWLLDEQFLLLHQKKLRSLVVYADFESLTKVCLMWFFIFLLFFSLKLLKVR